MRITDPDARADIITAARAAYDQAIGERRAACDEMTAACRAYVAAELAERDALTALKAAQADDA